MNRNYHLSPRIETSNNEMSGTRELGAQPKQQLFDHILPFGTKNKLKISILSFVLMVMVHSIWFLGFFGITWPPGNQIYISRLGFSLSP